jgi:uncharacterized membrane protein YphA (DoxX/SURF4 family)
VNVALWIVAIVLAAAFAAAGIPKVFTPRERLRLQMGWVDHAPDAAVKALGALEVAAAVGLILPALTRIAPVLTPVAAVGCAVTMVGASVVNGMRREYAKLVLTAGLCVVAVFVAWARFGPYPL